MQTPSGNYAIITGNGRSGSNWLLTMLDTSRLTHCRNEPHGVRTSPYRQLPNPPVDDKYAAAMLRQWDAFADWTANRMGLHDHRIIHPKDHVHRWSQVTGLAHLSARPRVQRALAPFIPALQRGEWQMPFWIGNQAKLSQALAIFKLIDMKAWAVEWLLQNRPDIPVIHIVRHPGGFLNSGMSRFFSTLSPQEQAEERLLYQTYLKWGVMVYPEWAMTLGDIEAMNLAEAVAWFWRFNNEMVFRLGQHAPNYLPIIYEELVQEPFNYAQTVFKHCQLPWTPDVEARIRQGLGISVWGKLEKAPTSVADSWKRKLSPELQALAQAVLSSSVMADWWEPCHAKEPSSVKG
ncbi:MAG TPA: sulfotransferase [Candidatus Obscuribacterales bacterium]